MRGNGFTLIELMVTIMVAAILLVLAMPSFLSSIHGQQVSSVLQNFEQDVAWVRGQAVSGVSPASLTLNTDCSWSVSIGTSTAAVEADHSMTTTQLAQDAPTIKCSGIPSGGLTLSFNTLGMVNSPGSTGIITFTPATGLSSSVEIFGSGVLVGNPQHAS